MLAAVPQVVTDIAAWAGALVAMIVAFGVLSKVKPFRWLWTQIVSDPLSGWFRGEVRHEVDAAVASIKAELTYNGGHSVKDQLREVRRHLGIDDAPDEPPSDVS